jgi:hypothetical protein
MLHIWLEDEWISQDILRVKCQYCGCQTLRERNTGRYVSTWVTCEGYTDWQEKCRVNVPPPGPDDDLDKLTHAELLVEAKRLRAVIRGHSDFEGSPSGGAF